MQLFSLHGGPLAHPIRQNQLGAHMQLFGLHGGPLAHPIWQNWLGNPRETIQPAQ
jgi:hypothetical protein